MTKIAIVRDEGKLVVDTSLGDEYVSELRSFFAELIEAHRPLHLAGPSLQPPPSLLVRTQFQGVADDLGNAFTFRRGPVEYINRYLNRDLARL